MCFKKQYAKGQLQSHSMEYTRSAQCEFLQPLLLLLIKVGLSLQKGNKPVSLKCLETRNVLCSEKEGRNRRCTSVRIKNERESRKNWSLARKKMPAERDHRHGHENKFPSCTEEESKRKFISLSVMSCPAGESGRLCGMRGGWSWSLQHFWYNSGKVLDSLVQSVTYVGPGKQPCHTVATGHAAECFHVLLPWANRNSHSKLSLIWK